MGGRLLRAWLLRPLVALERDSAIGSTPSRSSRSARTERGKFRETLKAVHDLERLVARAALGTAGPRDLVGAAASRSPPSRASRMLLDELQAPLVRSLARRARRSRRRARRDRARRSSTSRRRSRATAASSATASTRSSTSCAASAARASRSSPRWKTRERARTGIGSLKVRYNRVFGYYIEISKSNLHARAGRLPPQADDRRRRALHHAGAEGVRGEGPRRRRADPRARARDLRGAARGASRPRRRASRTPRAALATLDVLARAGRDGRGRRTTPSRTCTTATSCVATDARHPVVERHVARRVRAERHHARRRRRAARHPDRPEHGRQVHLPAADRAALPDGAGRLVRAGARRPSCRSSIASSRASAPPTTSRAASRRSWSRCRRPRTSCTRATSRSLVVLDEIGRGTATFDGLSLAWAVAEHLATNPRARPKTLFATHYHELTDLADALPGVVNFHVAAREWKDDIVFLRKIVPGPLRSQLRHPGRAARRPAAVGRRARARDPRRRSSATS